MIDRGIFSPFDKSIHIVRPGQQLCYYIGLFILRSCCSWDLGSYGASKFYLGCSNQLAIDSLESVQRLLAIRNVLVTVRRLVVFLWFFILFTRFARVLSKYVDGILPCSRLWRSKRSRNKSVYLHLLHFSLCVTRYCKRFIRQATRLNPWLVIILSSMSRKFVECIRLLMKFVRVKTRLGRRRLAVLQSNGHIKYRNSTIYKGMKCFPYRAQVMRLPRKYKLRNLHTAAKLLLLVTRRRIRTFNASQLFKYVSRLDSSFCLWYRRSMRLWARLEQSLKSVVFFCKRKLASLSSSLVRTSNDTQLCAGHLHYMLYVMLFFISCVDYSTGEVHYSRNLYTLLHYNYLLVGNLYASHGAKLARIFNLSVVSGLAVYRLLVKVTRSNCFVSLVVGGRTLIALSCGKIGFHKAHRSTFFAAKQLGYFVSLLVNIVWHKFFFKHVRAKNRARHRKELLDLLPNNSRCLNKVFMRRIPRMGISFARLLNRYYRKLSNTVSLPHKSAEHLLKTVKSIWQVEPSAVQRCISYRRIANTLILNDKKYFKRRQRHLYFRRVRRRFLKVNLYGQGIGLKALYWPVRNCISMLRRSKKYFGYFPKKVSRRISSLASLHKYKRNNGHILRPVQYNSFVQPLKRSADVGFGLKKLASYGSGRRPVRAKSALMKRRTMFKPYLLRKRNLTTIIGNIVSQRIDTGKKVANEYRLFTGGDASSCRSLIFYALLKVKRTLFSSGVHTSSVLASLSTLYSNPLVHNALNMMCVCADASWSYLLNCGYNSILDSYSHKNQSLLSGYFKRVDCVRSARLVLQMFTFICNILLFYKVIYASIVTYNAVRYAPYWCILFVLIISLLYKCFSPLYTCVMCRSVVLRSSILVGLVSGKCSYTDGLYLFHLNIALRLILLNYLYIRLALRKFLNHVFSVVAGPSAVSKNKINSVYTNMTTRWSTLRRYSRAHFVVFNRERSAVPHNGCRTSKLRRK